MPRKKNTGSGLAADGHSEKSNENISLSQEKKPNKADNVHSGYLEDNLTLEACRDRLRRVTARNEELEQFSTHIATQIHFKLDSTLQELRQKLDDEISDVSNSVKSIFSTELQKKTKGDKVRPTRKIFLPQESPLSKMLLYDDENYKTLSNILAVCLVLWGSAMFLDDVDQLGYPNYDLLVWAIFEDLVPFFKNWFVLFFASFIIVPFAHVWAESKFFLSKYILVLAYLLLQVAFFTFSAWVVFNDKTQFSMTLAIAFMVEQTRMSMKMHSYLREKVMWQTFNFSVKPVSSARIGLLDISIPNFDYLFGEIAKFSYFHFVPTLLFREKYPRTARVRWIYVIRHLVECVAVVYFTYLVFRTVLPQFNENVDEPITWNRFNRLTYRCMLVLHDISYLFLIQPINNNISSCCYCCYIYLLYRGPGMASMFIAHYLVLHSVQHVGAELTRFADRGFYQVFQLLV